MIFQIDRHASLLPQQWDEAAARMCIERIVAGTEDAFVSGAGWPAHPQDMRKPDPLRGLYFGDAGVLWALHHLRARGAVRLRQDYRAAMLQLVALDAQEPGSYLMGETGVLLLRHWLEPDPAVSALLAQLVEETMDHPARELMWGAPGTLLAALLMQRSTGEARWTELFVRTARKLWSQLLWSETEQCRYWMQELYGRQSTYLDAIHGFVATASPLIGGRDLLLPQEARDWQDCIVETVTRTAEWDGDLVNWRAQLHAPRGQPMLMQYCHGAPGFVICLADLPDPRLDDVLRAAGEAVWTAGPLRKGSNLCHGTGGNGYAFLKLYKRFGDTVWLERARAFAMHGIAQTYAAHGEYGQWRHSLWTGDPGFAIYLLDCIEGKDRFPTLDVFFA